MDLFSSSPENKEEKIPNQITLNLERDIVFFDIESTGLNVLQDRIIQIALIKEFANGQPSQELELLVNPGVPISPESMAIHGITPDKVANKPLFSQVANRIIDFIGDADLAGYNSDRFDLPMLTEELDRCGIDLDVENRTTVDVQKVFYKMEPRTLKAAYKVFCESELTDAHDALADVRATLAVFKGQIRKYENVDYVDKDGLLIKNPIKNDIKAINEFTADHRIVDFTQRLRRTEDGDIIFNFGKYMKQPVKEVFKRDRNYYHWIVQKDFSSQVKKIVRGIMDEIEREENSRS